MFDKKISKFISDHFDTKLLENTIMDQTISRVSDLIKKVTNGSVQIHNIVINKGKTVPINEVVHEKFEDVLKLVNLDIPVYLTGMAGTGKNVICKQIAKSLGLDFYFTNAVTQEYKLTGRIR